MQESLPQKPCTRVEPGCRTGIFSGSVRVRVQAFRVRFGFSSRAPFRSGSNRFEPVQTGSNGFEEKKQACFFLLIFLCSFFVSLSNRHNNKFIMKVSLSKYFVFAKLKRPCNTFFNFCLNLECLQKVVNQRIILWGRNVPQPKITVLSSSDNIETCSKYFSLLPGLRVLRPLNDVITAV